MKRIVLALLILCAIAPAASAGEPKVIELVDGSVITGEVVSLSNGMYTIRTDSLGTITVTESRVRAIRQKGADAAPAPDTAAQTRALQEQMIKDKEILSMIESLRSDPAFQKALNDPAVMKAVNAGDIAALTANPEFMKLLRHATVQDIKKKVGE